MSLKGPLWAVGGIAALLIVLLGAAVAVMETGSFDASASTPHGGAVSWFAHATFVNYVRGRAKTIRAPAQFTPEQVARGAVAYRQDCQVCHGAPGVGRDAWVAGMTPSPPYLLEVARRFSPAELYVIVNDGAKMTAMPAWGVTRSPAQVWDYVAYLESLPHHPA